MTPGEQGFLLLTSHLGDPERQPLTVAQFRDLTNRARTMKKPQLDRTLEACDLMELGYNLRMAERIVDLLESDLQLERYLNRAMLHDCCPITRIGALYPPSIRGKLGVDAPGCLWAKGDVGLLQRPAISLVGCRELKEENRAFAEEAGRRAADEGYVLVSGNARGADRTAQRACLAHGGCVISVVADELQKYPVCKNLLFLSENDFDEGFTTQRALSRNRIIHCLGRAVLVAQSNHGYGGTWDGTVKNLKHGWSPVFCFADGSRGTQGLVRLGACAIPQQRLSALSAWVK